MFSMPFSSRIINYEPPRGFLVLKFSAYDWSSDPFDHIMHYRQLMTLDIGNDALLCKVFPVSLQGHALLWFHRLPMNSVDNFRDLSKAFVGQYLCSMRHKQNISTLQNIKNAILQVEAYSMDVVLQIFKRSICPGTPFFESLAKKPPTTMDDLFQRTNKYSMLEVDVRAATQQILVTRQQAKNDQRPPGRRQDERAKPPEAAITNTPYRLFDFRWPKPIKADPTKRDHSKKCAYHKEHEHTTEQCRSLHYLVERLIKAGHLKYRTSGTPRSPIASKVVINYIHGGPLDEEYDSKRKRQRLLRAASVCERINSIRPGLTGGSAHPIDGTIIFPLVDPTRILQPYRDALILSFGIGDFDVRRILVDPGSSADLLQASDSMERQPLSLETLCYWSKQAQSSLIRTWLHYMKAIPSTYHQMVSFLTEDVQIDLYDSQLAAHQCYQIAR
uniref:Retrotransposon gag domain-containing protein n=1 Tax=Vitis vinifera TaxID=29760 RepID=A5AYP4_VITVI|nr:hypothetical protein VITISV_012512 [Vitis vinifera]